MRFNASTVGYRLISCKACRSNKHSALLNRKILAVTSPMLLKGTMVIGLESFNKKCSYHKSVRGLKNRLKILLSKGITIEPTSLPLLRLQVIQA
jgi:hypothetical protein